MPASLNSYVSKKCLEMAAMPLAGEVCSTLLDELDSGSVMLGGAFALHFAESAPIYLTWQNTDSHSLDIIKNIEESWCANSLAVLPLSRCDGWHKYAEATLLCVNEIRDDDELFGVELSFASDKESLNLTIGTGRAVFDSKWSEDLLIQADFGKRFRFKPATSIVEESI